MPGTKPINLDERRRARIEALPRTLSPDNLRREAAARVRYALSQLAAANVEQVQEWLTEVHKTEGAAKALDLYLKMLEYSVPKLSRAEVQVDHNTSEVASLSIQDLQELIRQNAKTFNGEANEVK